MNRLRADLLLVLITVIWGSTFVIVKQSLDQVGPFTFIAARFWVAGLGLLPFLALARRPPGLSTAPRAHLLREGWLTGLFLTLGFVTQTLGLQTTEAGKAAFITGLSVVLVPLSSALLWRQSPARAVVFGVTLATVGLGLMTLDRTLSLRSGDLWVLACAGGFAAHIIATGRFAPRHAVIPFTLVQLFTVAFLTTLAALWLESRRPLPPVTILPAVLYMGLVATALVFGLQTWGQRHTTPTHTALIFALEPVFAALFAAWFAAERLMLREWIGGTLIVLGMIVAELGPAVRAKSRDDPPGPVKTCLEKG